MKVSDSLSKLIRVGRPQFLISGLALFVFGALLAVRLGAFFSLSRLILGYLVKPAMWFRRKGKDE